MIAVTQRQDVMGREGRRVFDMQRPVRSGRRMPFSGRAWIGQLSKITIDTAEAGATKFLYLKFDGTHSWESEMPDVQPADGQVFDLDQTAGDIHMPGNFAG